MAALMSIVLKNAMQFLQSLSIVKYTGIEPNYLFYKKNISLLPLGAVGYRSLSQQLGYTLSSDQSVTWHTVIVKEIIMFTCLHSLPPPRR